MNFGLGETRNQSGAIGIDLGTRSTNIIALSRSGERLDIVAAGSVSHALASHTDGIISDPRSVGRLISRFVEQNSIPYTQAVFSIPSNVATLRWLTLPNLGTDERREAAKFKIRKHLPYSVESAYIETSVFNDSQAEAGECLAVAVPREVVESRAEALLTAGLVPIRAELEAQAILRVVERKLVRRSALWRDASLTIIDLGSSNTHMYVVQNQRLQFMRGVRFGSSHFINALAIALEIPPETASKLLSDPKCHLSTEGVLAIPFDETIAIVNLVPELEKLTREVSRLMRYFRSLHPERSYAGILDQAVLCGGLAGVSGLCAYLSHNLGLRVELARPIAGMMARFSSETFAEVSNRQEAYSVVMGLALGGIDQVQIKQGQEAELDFSWTRSA